MKHPMASSSGKQLLLPKASGSLGRRTQPLCPHSLAGKELGNKCDEVASFHQE